MDEREEKKKNEKTSLIYVVIGILTLVVAITGATFAYYTATSTVNNVITGNMASIKFDITVAKKTNVDNTRGLIPMTNSMVQKAVSNASTKGICLDDNGNAVCQVYKITINNSSTAGMYFDGYVTLTGGSGIPTDYTSWTGATATTMRWAQAFCTETSGNLASCTTAGTSTARQTETTGFTWTALGATTTSQLDKAEIIDTYANATKSATIQGNPHTIINKNYIRVSKHTGTSYVQANDITSALVYNQFLSPKDTSTANDTGDSSTTFVDAQVYYIVVWLSETGTDQTAGSGVENTPSSPANFFQGTVTFISAQGSEVTSRFGDYTAVTPDTTK